MSTAPPSPASKPAPPPDVRVLRVAQVDAGRLDDELVSLLREQFARVFARVSPGAVTRRRSELTLLLDALVFYFTVWSHRPTPGMELMSLRYRDEGLDLFLLIFLLFLLIYHLVPVPGVFHALGYRRQRVRDLPRVTPLVSKVSFVLAR